MKVGIVLPNWIGDVVMATPALRALRNHFGPDVEVAGIMRPYVAKVLDGTPWLDHHFYHDRKSKLPDLHTSALLGKLREWRPDKMVLLTNSLRTAAVAWMSGAKERIGYARRGRGLLLTQALRPPRVGWKLKPVSALDYYLNLAYAMGCPTESHQMELATSPKDEAAADRIWLNLRLIESQRVIVFNTGSATSPARVWPQASFIELAKQMVADPNTAVLVICGPGERRDAAEIARAADHPRVHSMADQDLSLGVAKAVIRRCQLMVTTDSGPKHIAAAFDRHVITLSGPIDPRWSDTHHARSATVQHQVACAPCNRSQCPLKHNACMKDLSVNRVTAAIQSQLNGVEVERISRRAG